MLDSGPDISQLGELLQFPRQEFLTRREDLAILAAIMSSVNVDGAGSRNAVSNKCRPIQNLRSLTNLDQFCNCVGVEEAEIRSLDLPRLMLRCPRKLCEIHRQERSVDQAVDEMVDELAEN